MKVIFLLHCKKKISPLQLFLSIGSVKVVYISQMPLENTGDKFIKPELRQLKVLDLFC